MMNKDKKGMTIIEVIVTIGVFSIIMIGVTMIFTSSWKNYNFIMNTNTSSIAAHQGISSVVDVIRKTRSADNGFYPIESVGDFDLIIFSDLDKDNITERVHYYLDGSDLMVGTSEPSGFPLTYPGTDSVTKVIISGITNTSSEPLFYYYDNTNTVLNTPIANLIDVRMVEVNFSIERKGSNDLHIESYASMRNLNEHDKIE